MENRIASTDPRHAAVAQGDGDAAYDLGCCYQTGATGVAIDLIEAHKWFNLACMAGMTAAQDARAEVASAMSARQIAAAQAAARAWMGSVQRRAA